MSGGDGVAGGRRGGKWSPPVPFPPGTYIGNVIADVHDEGAVVNALDGIVRLSLEPGTTRYFTAEQARRLAGELGRAAAATDGVEEAMLVKKRRRVSRKGNETI